MFGFKKIIVAFFLFAGIISVDFVLAENSLDLPRSQFIENRRVVVSEIAWMGTENSYSDEWIELYNNTDFSINLEGWILKAADNTPEIDLRGTIAAKGFYLLERTDNNTVSNIPADQIYIGVLNNNGETLGLYDNLGSLIDKIDCSSGWFTGDNQTKQTMERKDPLSSGSLPDDWQTSQSPGGTPKAKNSIIAETKPSTEEPKDQSSIGGDTLEQQVREQQGELPGRAENGSPGVALIASAIAIFSGTIIFLLKKETKKIYNK